MDALGRRLLLGGAAGAIAIVLIAVDIAAGAPLFALTSLLFWLVFGGPLFVWMVLPQAARDARLWPRRLAIAAASLSPSLPIALARSVVVERLGKDPVILVPIALVGVLSFLLWRRRELLHLPLLAGGLAASLLPITTDATAVAFLAVEAAAILALLPFRRSLDTWIRAGASALATLVAGLALLIVVRGSVFPPKLALGEADAVRLVLPLALLCVGVFAFILSRGGAAKLAGREA